MNIKTQIKNVIRDYGLTGKNICIHSSYKSLGSKKLKPGEIIETFLEHECTILSPTFSYSYMREPDEINRPVRNAWDYGKKDEEYGKNSNKSFHTDSNEIDCDMVIIQKTILGLTQRKRGNNPLDSFTAVGKNAADLVQNQTALDVYNPFKKLIESDGYIILMGVELNKMTLIHHSEKEAGRNMFIRWATGTEVTTIPVETGGVLKALTIYKNL